MNFKQRRRNFKRSARLSAIHMISLVRMLSASRRALPTFLIAGAQKGGTTSLYSYLIEHPNILPAYRRKEIHYWDNPRHYRLGMRWYRAHFPLIQTLQAASAVSGEKTPNYLERPEFIQRIRQDLPEVKLILLLRNPVERTISNYYMLYKRGWEILPLMDALLDEPRRLASPVERKKYGTERAYTVRSIYAPSIKACLEHFPPDQRLILDSQVFFEDPARVLRQVYAFLGVSPDYLPALPLHKNVGEYKKEAVPAEVIAYLRETFRPHNAELYQLLGVDFGWDA